jgi:MFS family permease
MPESQTSPPISDALALPAAVIAKEATRLRDLSALQWKTGIAAWLGWLFDGLDMHLYTLVAITFVGELLGERKAEAGFYSSWIMAAFLIGWALGGGFFGVIGDRIGRTRALTLTILTYALFTGLSYFAAAWWHLLILRFVAALGIGGEWAVGASLLAETWPRRWRPWMAAVLQTGVNCGVLLAALAVFVLAELPQRTVFLVGVLPALLVLWIRWAVPEPAEWHEARQRTGPDVPGFLDLFRGSVRRITLLSLTVCALALTGHWAFLFWSMQQLRKLPEIQDWSAGDQNRLVSTALMITIVASVAGNFVAALVARVLGYRRAIAILCLGYFASMVGAYGVPREYAALLPWLVLISVFHGVFALFTMYMPPLFPTLLRTSGAGFCYNFGRIAAAFGTVYFGLFADVNDFRLPLLYSSLLFIPAAGVAWLLPEPPDEQARCAGV